MQIINIALGGDIWQDLPSQCGKSHSGSDSSPLIHDVILTDNDERIAVNSYHHQAVNKLGDGLVATAVSTDGVIEAIRHTSRPICAVQWHPELMM